MWWWLIGMAIFGAFWGFGSRRTTVNNYNETYVDVDNEGGGGSGCCDDNDSSSYESGSSSDGRGNDS
jgi:hypothetical protein